MAAAKEGSFLIKDPVHGSIELSGEYLKPIIDSQEFQRLRKIKQLGGASYVYPGATHTRFEHSIGVCYIASELLKSLKEKDEFFGGTYERTKAGKDERDSDIKCVKIAALCHDLGHGPFSHLYDISIDKKFENEDKAHHEYRSVEIFKKINLNLPDESKFDENEEMLVGKLITFSKDYEGWKENENIQIDPSTPDEDILKGIEDFKVDGYTYPRNKIFLFEIVANGFTGIDVDKMDYFLRDGYLTGLPSIFDWRRYIQTLTVLPTDDKTDETGIKRLCSRDKEERELYQLFHIRTQLYHQVYRHKTTIAVEHMVGEALKKANEVLFIRGEDGIPRKILEAWQDIDSFLLLDDSIEDILMLDLKLEPPNDRSICFKQDAIGDNKDAKEMFRNIRKRKLCRYIGDTSLTDEDEFKLKAKEVDDQVQIMPFRKKAKFSYGMKDKNPIRFHYFYKKEPKPKPYNDKLTKSEMLPTKFEEIKFKCYVDVGTELTKNKLDIMKEKLEIL